MDRNQQEILPNLILFQSLLTFQKYGKINARYFSRSGRHRKSGQTQPPFLKTNTAQNRALKVVSQPRRVTTYHN